MIADEIQTNEQATLKEILPHLYNRDLPWEQKEWRLQILFRHYARDLVETILGSSDRNQLAFRQRVIQFPQKSIGSRANQAETNSSADYILFPIDLEEDVLWLRLKRERGGLHLEERQRVKDLAMKSWGDLWAELKDLYFSRPASVDPEIFGQLAQVGRLEGYDYQQVRRGASVSRVVENATALGAASRIRPVLILPEDEPDLLFLSANRGLQIDLIHYDQVFEYLRHKHSAGDCLASCFAYYLNGGARNPINLTNNVFVLNGEVRNPTKRPASGSPGVRRSGADLILPLEEAFETP